MGRSDPHLFPLYRALVPRASPIALLGFASARAFDDPKIEALVPDLFDISFSEHDSRHWNINGEWPLVERYESIVCTRCPYFARDPLEFFRNAHSSLAPGGKLFVDFGLGDHWRFVDYKVGWIKGGEHEWAYRADNFLWSCMWDESFLRDPQVQLFADRIKKFGYDDLDAAVKREVPSLVTPNELTEMFDLDVSFLALWEDAPQLYIIVSGTAR